MLHAVFTEAVFVPDSSLPRERHTQTSSYMSIKTHRINRRKSAVVHKISFGCCFSCSFQKSRTKREIRTRSHFEGNSQGVYQEAITVAKTPMIRREGVFSLCQFSCSPSKPVVPQIDNMHEGCLQRSVQFHFLPETGHRFRNSSISFAINRELQ